MARIEPTLRDRTCLVTGATGGIGFVTARELAARGANVIIVGRDERRGRDAVTRIRAATGNAWISFMRADLSSQADIRRLVRDFVEAHPTLDVLVNNAGGIFAERRLSADGIEMTFALNHLGYFLLTNLLLNSLRAAGRARIVNVASRAHVGARLDFDNLQGERGYRWWQAYANSKLCNLLFTYELARRLEGSGVTANALHPGFVATGLGQRGPSGNNVLFRALLWIGFRAAIGVEKGARTSIYLASAPEVEGVTGRYFVDCAEAKSSAASRDLAAQARLWEASERLTAITAPKVV